MRSVSAVALVLVLAPGIVFAQKKPKKQSMPEAIGQARYVYVESAAGEEFTPGLPPEDRIAIADVRDALHDWGRYTYTPEREKADLVFVVRKGRISSERPDVDMNGPQDSGMGGGPMTGQQNTGSRQMQQPTMARQPMGQPEMGGGEVGPQEDTLEVYQINANGKRSNILWSRSMRNGLSAPRLMLMIEFKHEVEHAYPKEGPQPEKP